MASITEICNLAISHLGIGKEIGNLETERSDEASACRRFYTICRDNTLRDFEWPFATKFADLALIEEDPTDEWAFSYGFPSDCIRLRRILSGTFPDTAQTLVSYRRVSSGGSQVIYNNQEDAAAEYTERIEDPSLYTPDFVLALSFLLASMIAPRITAGDPYKMGERAARMYLESINSAKANAVNEEQVEQAPEAELIQARE